MRLLYEPPPDILDPPLTYIFYLTFLEALYIFKWWNSANTMIWDIIIATFKAPVFIPVIGINIEKVWKVVLIQFCGSLFDWLRSMYGIVTKNTCVVSNIFNIIFFNVQRKVARKLC